MDSTDSYDLSDEEDPEDFDFDLDSEAPHSLTRTKSEPVKIFTPEDIQEMQSKKTKQVTDLLCVPDFHAKALLRHFHWNVGRLEEEWFGNEDTLAQKIGLNVPPAADAMPTQCFICFDDVGEGEGFALSCRHTFCFNCWKPYLDTQISEKGTKSLDSRCPMPKCPALVTEEAVEKLASPESVKMYKEFSYRSYVEENPNVQWCPGNGCENAVGAPLGNQKDSSEVYCTCGQAFCWGCKLESHRPVTCETIQKWVKKTNSEAENATWIIANTKNCPQKACRVPIEKNQGCMHMTCSKCRHEFCWLCLREWKSHSSSTGGYYACNSYEEMKKDGKLDPEAQKRENAKSSLERYTHYFERFDSHDKAEKKAKESRSTFAENWINNMQNRGVALWELKFMTDAWEQIIVCRHVLKWTYAYGFYLDDSDKAKVALFNFQQNSLESELETLHGVAENEAPKLEEIFTQEAFTKFKERLVTKTAVTKTYFDNLKKAFEEWENSTGVDLTKQSSEGAGPSTAAPAAPVDAPMMDYAEEDEDVWVCQRCTLRNVNNPTKCSACDISRYAPV